MSGEFNEDGELVFTRDDAAGTQLPPIEMPTSKPAISKADGNAISLKPDGIYAKAGVERVRLTTDGSHIYKGADILTFEEVKSLVMNANYFVTLTMDDNVSFLPSAYDGDAIWFDAGFIELGVATQLRVIINSSNQVNISQIELASLPELKHTELELAELKILGWNTPKELGVKNEVVDKNFIQKVGRIKLLDRYWQTDGIGVGDIKVYRMGKPLDCKEYSNSEKWNIYIDGYTTRPLVTNYVHDVASNDMSVGGRSAGGNYIECSTKIYDTYTAFRDYMDNSGLYLYYELTTPIEKPIDGNEIAVNAVPVTPVRHFAGDGRTVTAQAIWDAGVRDGTYIVNARRSESSSSTLFYVFMSIGDYGNGGSAEITDFECYKIAGQGDTINWVGYEKLEYMGADEQPSDNVTFDFIKINDFNNF